MFHLIKDGEHVDISDDEDIDPKEYTRIIKGKNQNMVKLQLYRDTKAVDRLRSSLHLIDAPRMNQRKIFVDSKEDLDKHVSANENPLPTLPNGTITQLAGQVKSEYSRLANRIDRKEKMENMYLKLETDKNLLVSFLCNSEWRKEETQEISNRENLQVFRRKEKVINLHQDLPRHLRISSSVFPFSS